FQSRVLTDDGSERRRYFAECKAKFQGCDLVFFDPDNGVQVASVGKGRRTSAKYVFWDEIEEAFAARASVLVYQHFARVERSQFSASSACGLGRSPNTGRMRPFRTPAVLFLWAAQPRHAVGFRRDLRAIERAWGGQIIASEFEV